MLLLSISPLTEESDDDLRATLSVVHIALLTFLVASALVIIGYNVMLRFSPGAKYAVFLCHHKAGAGALARFVKMSMQLFTSLNIFLDSDELENLALIFDIVRERSLHLVILLTPEVQRRMWFGVQQNMDGVATLTFCVTFPCESSMSPHLNKVTPSHHRFLLCRRWWSSPSPVLSAFVTGSMESLVVLPPTSRTDIPVDAYLTSFLALDVVQIKSYSSTSSSSSSP